MDLTSKCMVMIANAGEAKSLVLEAIKQAREGHFDLSSETMVKADGALVNAHKAHTDLLFYEADDNDLKLNLLTVHAADHLASAETIRILADEIILLYEEGKKHA
ncbi:MAG: PTS lactose/cellobiose transporter subunit IIA [Erysipelotrichia bacterium]|nr:PTS lactose/cellobiose transporter subunit IIA [Erysipelotrichia bacterium]